MKNISHILLKWLELSTKNLKSIKNFELEHILYYLLYYTHTDFAILDTSLESLMIGLILQIAIFV